MINYYVHPVVHVSSQKCTKFQISPPLPECTKILLLCTECQQGTHREVLPPVIDFSSLSVPISSCFVQNVNKSLSLIVASPTYELSSLTASSAVDSAYG